VHSHPAKFVKHYDKDFRLRATDKNNKTNFGFDGFDSKKAFGQIPLKGQVNQIEANQTMEYLKKSHIELGKNG
jgi:hypothetical protein